MQELKIVTTSWDDGHPKDLRVAELLRSKGLTGTFYIPIAGYDGGPTLATLDPGALRSLVAEGFEVGAHGVSHHTLPQFGPDDLACEVSVSKKRMEDALGQGVKMFCYPRGRYNAKVIQQVREAGYLGARTTRMFKRALGFDPFKMPTTLQAYPHGKSAYLRNLARALNFKGALEYVTYFIRAGSWVELGKRALDLVLREGGVWHLYGHSWEIEELGLWAELREMLDYVCKRDGVIYATNGEVLMSRPSGAQNGTAERGTRIPT